MNIKNYLWIIPFFSFSLGYIVMQFFFRIPCTVAPNLIGKHVHEILPLTTSQQLNIRLIDQKEESTIPEGIILNQIPHPGTSIKAHQQLLIVTTKKPTTITAPHCIGITIDHLINQLKASNITPRIHYLPHPYPENMCFAQSPSETLPLEKNHLLLYISSGDNMPIIWPDFIAQPLDVVNNFLTNHGIQAHIIKNDTFTKGDENNYIIKDQRPFAGTLVNLDKKQPLSVHLRIEPKDSYE